MKFLMFCAGLNIANAAQLYADIVEGRGDNITEALMFISAFVGIVFFLIGTRKWQ